MIDVTSNSNKAKASRMHGIVGRLRQAEDICQSEVIVWKLEVENALLRSVPSDSVGSAVNEGRAKQKVMHGVGACAKVGAGVNRTL